ncbi:MAG: translation initiation factor IF-1 [Candidatus Vogelbacteria bacterium]|nr:translation initiation factor IF-1 [Candidatus Vogelbacteria bacterium]
MENSSPKDQLVEAEVDGLVVEALPNMMFRVDVGGGKILLAYLAGKMRMNRIKVLIGDRVRVKLDQYGERGRVIRRY